MASKYPIHDDIRVPENILENWQVTADLLAEITGVPASLVMRVHADEIEVFVSSRSSGNVYLRGEKAKLDTGLYCETVMSSLHKLQVSNALKDPDWDHNPDITLGMISYCGLPLTWPDGKVFGTFCILDNKENPYSVNTHRLLERFHDSIQLNLATIYELHLARGDAEVVRRSLQDTEAKYWRLLDTANEGVWAIDADAKTVFVNARMAEMLGRDLEDVLGRPASGFMFEEDWSDHRQKTENRRKGQSEHYERRFRRKDGQTVWTLVSATPVLDEEHNFKGSFAMFTDITERKQAEEEVATLNRELHLRVAALERAAEQLEAFSYSLSHDMRTPLRAINGFVAILMEEYKSRLDETGHRYLEAVRRSTIRMGKLIDGLLEFIRACGLGMEMAAVDMGALTREVFEELRAASPERSISLHLGELPPAYCDEGMIRQVMKHLLSNAIKFTAQRTEAIVEVGASAEGENEVYYVKDNGAGFDMRYADKLFNVIFRLHSVEEFEGAAIGLAIVKRIVDRHGGRVWAEGAVDQGATFHFALPREEVQKRRG